MSHKSSLILLFCLLSIFAQAQTSSKLYNPEADAKADISTAVSKANKEGKYVFLQIGGNWCKWCLYFNKLVTEDNDLNQYINNHFVVAHVNYSPENKNTEVLASLDYPQRFGFPVFVILDGEGKRLHTQNSEYLEEGQGHSKEKVLEFLEAWSKEALNPENY